MTDNALELMDEIQSKIGLRPTPLTWAVGNPDVKLGSLVAAEGQSGRCRSAGASLIAPAPPEGGLSIARLCATKQ